MSSAASASVSPTGRKCPQYALFGSHPIFDSLIRLDEMDKTSMSGRCHPETTRMEQFMETSFQMRNIKGQYFVDGVRAFTLEKPLSSYRDDDIITFTDSEASTSSSNSKSAASFEMSAKEVRDWQSSYRIYALSSYYPKDDDLQTLEKCIRGQSSKGSQAFGMKFVVRASINPILCDFDGVIHSRRANDAADHRIWLLSVTGIDFAGRHHDEMDIKKYIQNWNSIFLLSPTDSQEIAYPNGRDFIFLKNQPPQVRWDVLYEDLLTMVRMRLYSADSCGVSIVIETGIGLGVFSGDQLGIGPKVRELSAKALREVLEKDVDRFGHVEAVVCALPIFRKRDNFDYFVDAFKGYTGKVPVLLIDQDMHKLARCSAMNGYTTSELNPADSHGVFGEYWQNRGPGTEEKLALTTLGLLTQHHAVNPHVLDITRYHRVDVQNYDNSKHSKRKPDL